MSLASPNDQMHGLFPAVPWGAQGLLGNKEGAVLRTVEKGSSDAKTPWRLLYQLNDKFVQVRQHACA